MFLYFIIDWCTTEFIISNQLIETVELTPPYIIIVSIVIITYITLKDDISVSSIIFHLHVIIILIQSPLWIGLGIVCVLSSSGAKPVLSKWCQNWYFKKKRKRKKHKMMVDDKKAFFYC